MATCKNSGNFFDIYRKKIMVNTDKKIFDPALKNFVSMNLMLEIKYKLIPVSTASEINIAKQAPI